MSLMTTVEQYLPSDWRRMDQHTEVDLVDIPSDNPLYATLANQVKGSFNLNTKRIVCVQNPYLYGQFLIKKLEYETDRMTCVRELFHDTAESNISSIAKDNLNWRMVSRAKYGQGVSFSCSPAYANQKSSRKNGVNRAMIIADVLIGLEEMIYSSVTLPSSNYDTTVGNYQQVYVKYYDNEFYPKYVVYYTSKSQPRRRW